MNKLRSLIESVGLSFKGQLIIFIVLNLSFIGCGVAFFFFVKKPIVFAFLLFVLVLIDFIFLSRYKSLKSVQNQEILMKFVSLLPFFKTYLDNGYTVYQSLNELCSYCQGELLQRVENLVREIDEDKTVNPFINFAYSFNSLQIEQLMICVYQMIDEGCNSNNIYQFQLLFEKIRGEMLKSTLQRKESSLSNMTIFPLIGSAVLIVMITFGVIAVIGESINGI